MEMPPGSSKLKFKIKLKWPQDRKLTFENRQAINSPEEADTICHQHHCQGQTGGGFLTPLPGLSPPVPFAPGQLGERPLRPYNL